MEHVLSSADTLRLFWAHLEPRSAAALSGTCQAAQCALVTEMRSMRFVCCRGTPLGVLPAVLAQADRRGQLTLGLSPRAARFAWVRARRTGERTLTGAVLRSFAFLLRHAGAHLPSCSGTPAPSSGTSPATSTPRNPAPGTFSPKPCRPHACR